MDINRRRRLRVALADRPGSLASLATALAAHDVDILRLDVVSRDRIAVDDLWIELSPDERVADFEAVLARLPGIKVLAFEVVEGAPDPVSVMAEACAHAAEAGALGEVRSRGIEEACRVAGARDGVLLRPAGDGRLRVTAASVPKLPDVAPSDPCLARDAASGGCPITAHYSDSWAPDSWRTKMPAAAVAAIPLGVPDAPAFACMLLVRDVDVRFELGEVDRLAQYARVLAGLLRAHGDGGGVTTKFDASIWMPPAELSAAAEGSARVR